MMPFDERWIGNWHMKRIENTFTYLFVQIPNGVRMSRTWFRTDEERKIVAEKKNEENERKHILQYIVITHRSSGVQMQFAYVRVYLVEAAFHPLFIFQSILVTKNFFFFFSAPTVGF